MREYLRKFPAKIVEKTLSPRASIRKVSSGAPLRGEKKLCLYAHWDQDGIIDDYVLYAIHAWQAEGYDVVLISTSPKLEPRSLANALKICSRIVWRFNVGLDFASWKAGADALGLPLKDLRHLVLTNDSVFGPFFPLAPWLERGAPVGLTGFTDSNERAYHLQSYCLMASANLLQSQVFAEFWDNIRVLLDKEDIINRYEVGLSRDLLRQNEKITPLISCSEATGLAQKNPAFQYGNIDPSGLNPTLHLWDTLIEAFRYPFLKTELLKKNRLASERVGQWKQLLPPNSDQIITAIERHVQRVSGNQLDPLRQYP